MNKVLIAVRGYFKKPIIYEVSLEEKKIVNQIEIDVDLPESIPPEKKGITEIQYYKNYLVAATWDRIIFLNPVNYHVEKIITDIRFSDLHAIHADNEGLIWLANTNIDSIFIIDNLKVEPFWSPNKNTFQQINAEKEGFNKKTKFEIPFYKYHINGVYSNGNYLYVTYLGQSRKYNRLQSKLIKLGILEKRYKSGGYFIVDKQTRKIYKQNKTEGLHNTIFDGKNIFFVQYFGNAIIKLNLNNLSQNQIKLICPESIKMNYLSRGLYLWKNNFWVGHTPKRGWELEIPHSLLRCYDNTGQWTGEQIIIPDTVGIYSIIEKIDFGNY